MRNLVVSPPHRPVALGERRRITRNTVRDYLGKGRLGGLVTKELLDE